MLCNPSLLILSLYVCLCRHSITKSHMSSLTDGGHFFIYGELSRHHSCVHRNTHLYFTIRFGVLITEFGSHLSSAFRISFFKRIMLLVNKLLSFVWYLLNFRTCMNEALINPLEATENAFVLLSEALMTSCCAIYSSLFFHVLSVNFDWWLYSIVFRD